MIREFNVDFKADVMISLIYSTCNQEQKNIQNEKLKQ